MKLDKNVIIGSYSSNKIMINSFDIQRTQERTLQQTKNKKVVGDTRQNIKITLDGRLMCTSFVELEEEIQKLLYALNKKVINLVIGATPDRFYRVSWSGAGLARRAGQGGPNLPFSLEFDCIDEGAFTGIPVTYGGTKIDGIPFMVSNLGKPIDTPRIKEHHTFFVTGTSLVNALDGTGVRVSNGIISLFLSGENVATWKVYKNDSYKIGLVFEENRTVVYIDGKPYIHNHSYVVSDWVFNTTNIIEFGALPFIATKEYMYYLSNTPSSYIIQGRKLEGSSLSFMHEGANNTPASIYTTSSITPVGITLGDFGARYYSISNGWFNFNTIEGSITSSKDDYQDSITYNGRFTLFPYINRGVNKLERTEGNADIYIFWREMVK